MTTTENAVKTLITFNAKELKAALVMLGKVKSPGNATIPLLSMLKVSELGSRICLEISDFEQHLRVYLSAEVDKGDTILPYFVNFKELQTTVKAAKAQDAVCIEFTDNGVTVALNGLTSGIADGCPAHKYGADYPELPKPGNMKIVSAPRFFKGLQAAYKSASRDLTRFVLNGAYVGGGCIVGTDGRRLTCSQLGSIEAGQDDFAFEFENDCILPLSKFLNTKTLQKTENLMGGLSAGNGSSFCLSAPNWSFTTKLVEGHYPNWRQIVPTFESRTHTLDLSSIAAPLMSLCKGVDKDTTIRLHAKKDVTRVQVGSRVVELPGGLYKDNGGNLAEVHLAFNPQYLLEPLQAGWTKVLTPRPSEAITHPMIMLADGNTNEIYIVMPMRA